MCPEPVPARLAPPELFTLHPVRVASFAREKLMNSVIYIVGLVVVVIAILSFFGLR